MTLFIDPLRDDPQAVVDELLYINYKTNRQHYPGAAPEGWVKVYGPATADMEARYQREMTEAIGHIERRCPWGYPIGAAQCRAPVTVPVRYRVRRRTVWYCLNHAQREVLGGQADYAPRGRPNICDDCGGVIGPWLGWQVTDSEARECSCGGEEQR